MVHFGQHRVPKHYKGLLMVPVGLLWLVMIKHQSLGFIIDPQVFRILKVFLEFFSVHKVSLVFKRVPYILEIKEFLIR